MKLDVNIDVELKSRTPEYVQQIVSHVENLHPFIIYHDKENYVRVYPVALKMVAYDEYGNAAFFECVDRDEFLVRLKLFITTHENFHSMIPTIDENAYRQSSDTVKELDYEKY